MQAAMMKKASDLVVQEVEDLPSINDYQCFCRHCSNNIEYFYPAFVFHRFCSNVMYLSLYSDQPYAGRALRRDQRPRK